MVKYDLVAIDIDGTLVNSVHEITPAVADAVKRVVDSGSRIVLCTGRPYPGAKAYMEELGLTKEGDYIINYHGALVQRTDSGKVVINHQLSHDEMIKWHEFVKEMGISFQAIREDGVFSEAVDFTPTQLIEPFVNTMNLHIRTLADLDPEMKYSKFVIQDEVELIDQLDAAIPAELTERYTVIRSMPTSIEILNKDASKGRTLKELADHLGIPRERVMAIGDSGNDIDMVDYAGLGVAMGNAVPAVRDVADVVTTTNNENGVAEAINRHFFDLK